MKVVHLGHEIEVRRERCLGGWTLLYYTVTRLSNGLECECHFMDTTDTPRTIVECLKKRVEDEVESKDPWDHHP